MFVHVSGVVQWNSKSFISLHKYYLCNRYKLKLLTIYLFQCLKKNRRAVVIQETQVPLVPMKCHNQNLHHIIRSSRAKTSTNIITNYLQKILRLQKLYPQKRQLITPSRRFTCNLLLFIIVLSCHII